MGMLITAGFNGGYPYVQGLPEAQHYPDTPPYFQFCMRCSPDVNRGYPFLAQLPPMGIRADMPPYPEYIMRCIGEDFNSGYPLIMQLHGIQAVKFSDLYFADKRVYDMNFEGRYVFEGICNGQKVYGTRYESY